MFPRSLACSSACAFGQGHTETILFWYMFLHRLFVLPTLSSATLSSVGQFTDDFVSHVCSVLRSGRGLVQKSGLHSFANVWCAPCLRYSSSNSTSTVHEQLEPYFVKKRHRFDYRYINISLANHMQGRRF